MNWDYKKIYKTEELFNEDLKSVVDDAKNMTSFKGKLHELTYLEKYLSLNDKLEIKLEKLFIYANLNYSKNSKDLLNQQRQSNVMTAYSNIVNLLSFAEPELISLGRDYITNLTLKNDKLAKYEYYFDKLFKNSSHILDEKSESIIANYNQALRGFNSLHQILSVADNSDVEVLLSDNSLIKVNASNYRSYLEDLVSQDDRRKVFEAIFKFYEEHKQTFASIYNGIMQSEYANVKNRNYNSILESHLDINNIPKEVFLTLINTTKANTAPIKKYYELRRKYFNLAKIHTYDRFLQFKKTNNKYSYDDAKEIFFKAVKKICGEFEKKAHLVLEEGRVDVLPSDGKRSGAFSTGSYEKGTFIMLNHTGNLDSVFTLAHEAGHSMHTMFANENQPYATSNYVIFVAEIASTFNESLLLDYLLSKDLDDDTKIVLLQQEIDNILSTFYRQALFADFEYQAHNLVEANKPITYSNLSQIMKDLYQTYYGIDLTEEKYKEYVWAYIPHLFNSPFYVYQYATSYAASQAIYQKVKNNEKNALDDYLRLLKAGGSDYPVNLVKKANVDLTTKEPFMAVVNRLEELVDRLEHILNLA